MHVAATLERMANLLSDEGWNVVVSGNALRAERYPGAFYTGVSPVARASRGRLGCWFDGSGLQIAFKPDWFPMLVDAGLLGLGYAVTRGVAALGSRWADAGVAFGIFALVLPTLMPLVRVRFVTMLARAVWATDNRWEKIRERGGAWRLVWMLAGAAAFSYWLLTGWVVPFLYGFATQGPQIAWRAFPHDPLGAVKLVLFSAVAALGLAWLLLKFGSDNQVYYPSRRSD